MKKIKIYCFSFFALLMLCACAGKNRSTVLDWVPTASFLVLEADSPSALQEVLSPFAESENVFQNIGNQLNRMESILSAEAILQQRIREAHIAFALTSVEESIEQTIVIDLDKELSINKLYRIIASDSLSVKLCRFDGFDYLMYADTDTCFALTQNHFLVLTSDESLLHALQAQYNHSENTFIDADFSRIQTTLGSSVPVHLYLNYSQMDSFINASASKKYKELVEKFTSNFNGIATLDVLPKADGLVLNGYSLPTDSVSSLRPLKYQRPMHNSVVNVLPYNTKVMLHFGMSDYASFWEEFIDSEQITALNKRYRQDVETQFINGFSEVSHCIFGPATHAVFVGRMNDPTLVIQFMNQVGARFGISESVVVQGYTLNKVNVSNFVPSLFGEGFKELTSCCYSIMDQFLVIANDFIPIQEVISCYRSGRTLDLSENFKAFQNNMLESANISLYVVCADNQNLIKRYVGGDLADFIKKSPAYLQDYQAFSIQFASSKDLIYTCFNLRNMTDVKEETNVQWKANLDAPLKGKPYLIPDKASSTEQVVVFDVNNVMYLIDCRGNVKWKRQLEEAPMSVVKVVDYYRNGDLQLLFNTANYLELIDCEGNDLPGFPKRLLAEASNGLSVFDYDGNKNYRVMLCGVDKFVYNYDLRGDETEGWNRHRTDAVVTEPVQHLVADNKDFIIVTDIEGTVRILDRQGRIRIPLRADMHKSQWSDFYENKTNHKGIILTSDNVGNLLYIANDGDLARTEFGQFSADHYFLYEDFNGDQDPDFIYLDGRELRVFNRFKKILYSHDFDAEIKTKPVFFRLSRNKRLLGIVSESAREIYLIDKNGNMIVSSGLVGETAFAIGSLKGNNEINLLTGVGNSLFNYLIY